VTRARRVLVIGAGAVLALVLVLLAGRALFRQPAGGGGVAADDGLGVGMQAVTLYFADPEAADLAIERRDLIVGTESSTLVAAALGALAEGPLERLARIVPEGTRVRNVFVDADGAVYADFTGELARGMAGAGLSQEILLLRSFARTLGVNFRNLRTLVILVDGRTVPSLGGRIATDRPLVLAEWQ
jgi:hypothetical protein